MTTTKTLRAEQRGFLLEVTRLAFANPFSPDHAGVLRKLARLPPNAAESRIWTAIAGVIGRHLDAEGEGASTRIDSYAEADRPLIHIAALLRHYAEYRGDLDVFIAAQAQSAKPIALPFGKRILRQLEGAGFAPGEAARSIALLYQLRRAAYFITHEIIGRCPAIVALRMHLWNAVFTHRPEWYVKYLCGKMEDFSTLLLGETGTGKTAAARAIGLSGFIPYDAASQRFIEGLAPSFLSVNLAEYPASLIESQLFGHKKGAFTGAIAEHRGVFSRCSAHGSVFIDEIGDLDLTVQLKLLAVLQERSFTPVGSRERLDFHGRVIAATNRDLDELRASGRFRDDFYYRLCSDVITLPTLRRRFAEDAGELRLILAALLARAIGPHAEPFAEQIEARIRECLPRDYPWPGNVRELEQCVRRLVLTGTYDGDIGRSVPSSELARQFEAGQMKAMALLAAYCQALYRRHGSYVQVASITGLDRRTVRKYVAMAAA